MLNFDEIIKFMHNSVILERLKIIGSVTNRMPNSVLM